MERATALFAPPPGALGRGQKIKYHLISITKSISTVFIPNFVCVLTNERHKTYQMSPAPEVGLWDAGVPRWSILFQIWSCGIANRRG